MQDRWDPSLTFDGPLAECVYGSRLIGGDPYLVLHGGGNTSVKAPWIDVTGDEIEALYVKGSGWDLGAIETAGFAHFRSAAPSPLELTPLGFRQMASLSAARLGRPPQPSVGRCYAILARAVLHSRRRHRHLTNLSDGEERVRRPGDEVDRALPMPGFDLASGGPDVAEHGRPDTPGMVLMNHGLFALRHPGGVRPPRRPHHGEYSTVTPLATDRGAAWRR